MADKPSRGLVLYGDGLMRFVKPSHTHLHSFASRSTCGFLSLSNHSPNSSSENEDKRIVREFAELLDTHETCPSESEEDSAKSDCQKFSTIAERFMGMKAAIITNDSCLQSYGNKHGLSILQPNEIILSNHPHVELLKLLGFQEGKTLETNQFDLVFVHIGAEEDLRNNNVEYLNELVGKVLQIAAPGSEIGARLHFSVVMSYGDVSENDDPSLSVFMNQYENGSDLSKLFPRQSYTVKGGHPRSNVRHYCPMLSAQWQDAVTRKDMVDTYSFKDFKEHGGNLTIPADRFLYEIAFKLWKAPKYGA